MKNKILLFLVFISFIGYSQNPTRFPNGIQITGGQVSSSTTSKILTQESDGKVNFIDADIFKSVNETTGNFANVQTLINNNPEGTTINLKPNTIYVQDKSLVVKNGITINGNGATLKRDAQQTVLTTVSANQASTTLTLASIPSGWVIGDYVQIYTSNLFTTASRSVKITNISGNVLTLSNALSPTNTTNYNWPIGSTVRKVYDQIRPALDNSGFVTIANYTINNLTIDGNSSNNAGNYYWGVNSAVWSLGKSIFNNCKFINTPNENMLGAGFHVINCYAENLNGSFVHQSTYSNIGDSNIDSVIYGNTTKNSNIISSTTGTGHSEGVITFSFTSGRTKIFGNRFLGGGQSVIGRVSYAIDPLDGSNKDFIFTGNYAENFPKVVDNFSYDVTYSNLPDNWFVTDNIFSNCGSDNWFGYTTAVNNMGVLKFYGNILTNGTAITNIPEKMKSPYLDKAGTLNYLPKRDSNGNLIDSQTFDNGTNIGFGTNNPQARIHSSFTGTNEFRLEGSLASWLRFYTAGNVQSYWYSDTSATELATNNYFSFVTGGAQRLKIDATGLSTFSGNVVVPTPTISTHAANKGYVDSVVRPYKVYTAKMSQSGTSAPTVTINENTIGSIVWSYLGVGNYSGTLTGAFTDANKVQFFTTKGGGTIGYSRMIVGGADQVYFQNYDSTGTAANGLNNENIEIRIYN